MIIGKFLNIEFGCILTASNTYDTIIVDENNFAIVIISDTNSCSEVYHQFSGNITSPNFPNAYPDSAQCCSKIVLNSTQSVYIWFTSFKIEYEASCSYDYLFILPGQSADQTCTDAIIAAQTPSRCGNVLPEKMLVQSNIVMIYFRSDSIGDGSTGFQLHYQGGKLRNSS